MFEKNIIITIFYDFFVVYSIPVIFIYKLGDILGYKMDGLYKTGRK